jgi:hypothetical protein
MSKRNPATLGTWGPAGTRVVAAESYWRAPVRWNANAEGAEERPRVFCASLADVFEDWHGPMVNSVGLPLYDVDGRLMELAPGQFFLQAREPATMDDVRRRLFRLIDATPNLDWLLLTKQPENVERLTPTYFPGGYVAEAGTMNQEGPRPNVWIGTSAGTQESADRFIPHLLKVPAAVRFLSCEPLLGPVNLHPFLCKHANPHHPEHGYGPWCSPSGGIGWVVVGGESGPKARPCRVEWIRSIVEQCRAAGVPIFVKQLGSNPTWTYYAGKPLVPFEQPYCASSRTQRDGIQTRTRLRDRHGGDPSEWPADLRVREVPTR